MISRSRSAPTAAAMSIECTTSAKRIVTCLYSADWVACVSRVPHSPQNLAVGLDCAPQEPQNSPVAVSPPPPSPLGSTSVSFHCWSTMSVISPCHLRPEVLRPSYIVLFRDTGIAHRPDRPSPHRLGPLDVPLEAQRCRHRALAIPIVAVGGLVSARPCQ